MEPWNWLWVDETQIVPSASQWLVVWDSVVLGIIWKVHTGRIFSGISVHSSGIKLNFSHWPVILDCFGGWLVFGDYWRSTKWLYIFWNNCTFKWNKAQLYCNDMWYWIVVVILEIIRKVQNSCIFWGIKCTFHIQ